MAKDAENTISELMRQNIEAKWRMWEAKARAQESHQRATQVPHRLSKVPHRLSKMQPNATLSSTMGNTS